VYFRQSCLLQLNRRRPRRSSRRAGSKIARLSARPSTGKPRFLRRARERGAGGQR
jgi:hypothetical protein